MIEKKYIQKINLVFNMIEERISNQEEPNKDFNNLKTLFMATTGYLSQNYNGAKNIPKELLERMNLISNKIARYELNLMRNIKIGSAGLNLEERA